MTSNRYATIELQDALRQLWYIPPADRQGEPPTPPGQWWETIAKDNPNWQLTKRKRYSLNFIDTSRTYSRDPISPYVPPVPEDEDNQELIVPKLYDNVNEFGIAATSSPAPITGIVVQYKDGNPQGLIEVDPDVGRFGRYAIAVFEAYLFVMNQDAPTSRLMRYLSWFTGQAVPLDNNLTRPAALRDLVIDMKTSDPVRPTLSGPFSEINRQAAVGIVIECEQIFLTPGSEPVTSEQDIFEATLNDP